MRKEMGTEEKPKLEKDSLACTQRRIGYKTHLGEYQRKGIILHSCL